MDVLALIIAIIALLMAYMAIQKVGGLGDLKKQTEVLTQIKTAYAHAKAKALPTLVLPVEPRQMAFREIVEEAAVELGHFHYSCHIPDLFSAVVRPEGHPSIIWEDRP